MVNEIGYDIKGPRIIPINVWFHNFPFFVRNDGGLMQVGSRFGQENSPGHQITTFLLWEQTGWINVRTNWAYQPEGQAGQGPSGPDLREQNHPNLSNFASNIYGDYPGSWYMPELIRTKTQSLTDRRWIYYQVIEAEFRVVTSQLSFSFPSSQYVSYLVIDILVKVGHRVAWHIRVLRIHVKIVYH